MSNRKLAPVAILMTVFGLVAALFGSTVAQGPDATPAEDGAVTGHPAHIHSGSCEDLGDVVYPLNNIVTMDRLDATPVTGMAATPSSVALISTPVIAVGQNTTVDVSLDDLLAAEHAINVHESPENIDIYIACGDITGTVTDGVLLVDLQELNDSGYMGQARLMDNGDGTTTVYMDLIPAGEATPAA